MLKGKQTKLTATRCLDLGDQLTGFELLSISIGPVGELYLLAVTEPADYRELTSTGVEFAKITTDRIQDFAIIRFGKNDTVRFDIPGQQWNFHHVQPLPDREILLVSARSRYRGEEDYDRNAKVFYEDGTFRREFLLGDGIQDVQATTDGRIWTSYFDEGVFGNFGWNDPIGKKGLVLWDKSGDQLYEYNPSDGLDWICDCYALNVVSDDETWCYYYADFPLVCIRNQQIQAYWTCPVKGASGFALWQDMVFFRGNYHDRDLYYLFELARDGSMKPRSVYRAVNERGEILRADLFASRGNSMFFVVGNYCYHVDLKELVS